MIDLEIETMTFGGRGLGRADGKATFVPFTMPGDFVRCQIVQEKKRHCVAELVEVLRPSAGRIKPCCPVFTQCGGCQWQHLPYNEQLKWKESLFHEILIRAMTLNEEVFHPVIASPQPWNYRCRVQIKCRMTEAGFVAGFYRSGSHFVVDMKQCPIMASELNDLFSRIKPLFAGFSFAHRVPQLDLAVDDAGHLSLIVHFLDRDVDALRELLEPIGVDGNCSVYVNQGYKMPLIDLYGAASQVITPSPGMDLQFPPGGFVQVNLEQNRQLVADVLSHIPVGSKVIDLYCGIGNFSLPVAGKADRVVGIEEYAPAIDSARDNCIALGIDNADFFVADSVKGLKSEWRDGFDLVLLDPPRSGALDVVKELIVLKPQKIIYVSCDPMTLGRDLKHLIDNDYEPVYLRGYDMFPQTGHIEGIAVLELPSS